MILKKLFGFKCQHEFGTPELQKIADWRVSQNAYHEIYTCKKCGFRQWGVGYYDEKGNPQYEIPPLRGECELSER